MVVAVVAEADEQVLLLEEEALEDEEVLEAEVDAVVVVRLMKGRPLKLLRSADSCTVQKMRWFAD